ncbi:hypothetical protein GH741_20530 [Aquibacillus halophilus]|uniref:Uncharacterized protein n=1 Tax=Aquibacillus halophilus TaxID=930132 RepID=A0A6A8DH84_9BACI|nr:hypothetical protein [Aquibacillus halophilus]MRH45033.1 hypothetical protein [Aquibacillus halophilus]
MLIFIAICVFIVLITFILSSIDGRLKKTNEQNEAIIKLLKKKNEK